ncbi:MAG TPA: hypothetical protein VFF44_03690 [Casimicrobiaceae bacterium]|nr:hypothetical protein [Casimicrobiaceae bacterium]
MTTRTRRTRSTLRHWGNFLTGTAIGAAVQTPVFAATDFIPSDWTARITQGDWPTLLLIGAVILLVVGVALRVLTRSRGSKVPPPIREDSIGRYRPNVHH